MVTRASALRRIINTDGCLMPPKNLVTRAGMISARVTRRTEPQLLTVSPVSLGSHTNQRDTDQLVTNAGDRVQDYPCSLLYDLKKLSVDQLFPS